MKDFKHRDGRAFGASFLARLRERLRRKRDPLPIKILQPRPWFGTAERDLRDAKWKREWIEAQHKNRRFVFNPDDPDSIPMFLKKQAD